MSHSQGRRKPHHIRGRGEAPSSSSYRSSSAGHRDEYYPQDYPYRSSSQVYSSPTPAYTPQDYAHDAPWSYEQERLDYDPRSWRREEERRRSPVYEDYHGYREDSSGFSGPRNEEWRDYGGHHYSHPYPYSQAETQYSQYNYSSQALGEYDRYPSNYRDYRTSYSGYSDYGRMPDAVYHDTRSSRRDYEDNRRPRPPATEYHRRESYPNYPRRSASPPSTHSRGFASQARAPIKAMLFQSPPIIRSPSPPPPPKRTEPTDEYLSISLQPSPRISNSSEARKLIVLDLNGSLVLRSAHSRRTPLPRYAAGRGGTSSDPYADPTQLRPLRTVHRRPYLTSFTAYLLHDQTKAWLDTMVWSSAQPHSVADMVEHCFGERKSELKAVWARDTLGLTADDYHKKSLTLKDLEKPWAELSFIQDTDSQSQISTTAPGAVANASPSSHSALTTLLVDDSPAKAALQPWNHLCIRDYVQGMRNMDLLVADWEMRNQSKVEGTVKSATKVEQVVGVHHPGATLRVGSQQAERGAATQHTPNITENDGHPVQNITREVVMVEGELVGEEVIKTVIREVVMIDGQMVNPDEPILNEPTDPNAFVPNQKRKAKRLAKKENARFAREEKEREAFLSLREQQLRELGQTPAPATIQPQGEDQASEVPSKNPEPEMRYDETLLAVIGVLDHVKHEGNVAGWMRSGGLLHTALPEQPQASAQPKASRKHSPPSRDQSPSQSESPMKKSRLSHISNEEPPSFLPTPPPTSQMTEFNAEEQASTGVPLSSPIPRKQAAGSAASAGLWYEDPAVLMFWADRGRDALKELGIKEESGMVAVSGAVQNIKI